MTPMFALTLLGRRVARAERRAAEHLNNLAWLGTGTDGRWWVDSERTTDVCARVREARADLVDARRSW